MDRRSIRAIPFAIATLRDRISPVIWPLAAIGMALIVAACGKGNGGGPGY